MTTPAQAAANCRYDAAHTRQVKLKLNLKTDADILKRLDAEPNTQGYIKRVVREDIAKREFISRGLLNAEPTRSDPSKLSKEQLLQEIAAKTYQVKETPNGKI